MLRPVIAEHPPTAQCGLLCAPTRIGLFPAAVTWQFATVRLDRQSGLVTATTCLRGVSGGPALHRERASRAIVVSGVLGGVSGADASGGLALEPLRRTVEVRGVL